MPVGCSQPSVFHSATSCRLAPSISATELRSRIAIFVQGLQRPLRLDVVDDDAFAAPADEEVTALRIERDVVPVGIGALQLHRGLEAMELLGLRGERREAESDGGEDDPGFHGGIPWRIHLAAGRTSYCRTPALTAPLPATAT